MFCSQQHGNEHTEELTEEQTDYITRLGNTNRKYSNLMHLIGELFLNHSLTDQPRFLFGAIMAVQFLSES